VGSGFCSDPGFLVFTRPIAVNQELGLFVRAEGSLRMVHRGHEHQVHQP